MDVEDEIKMKKIEKKNIGRDNEIVDLRSKRENIMGKKVSINGCRSRMKKDEIIIM
ncbi:hypothetical protein [Salmonella enterica]|uniref:hypothetical protein n=1 Tax=Salmonella enterica TaxID=28901 RepID=UPI0015629324